MPTQRLSAFATHSASLVAPDHPGEHRSRGLIEAGVTKRHPKTAPQPSAISATAVRLARLSSVFHSARHSCTAMSRPRLPVSHMGMQDQQADCPLDSPACFVFPVRPPYPASLNCQQLQLQQPRSSDWEALCVRQHHARVMRNQSARSHHLSRRVEQPWHQDERRAPTSSPLNDGPC